MLHVDYNETDAELEETIREIRALSDIPIDLHIISSAPWQLNSLVSTYGIETVTWQLEAIGYVPQVIPVNGTNFGLAITSETPVDVLKEVQGFGYVMLMCTTPGVSGGIFQKENLRRIIEVKNRFPQLKIQVDGGVNDEIAFILRLLGVDSIVSGSFLMNHFSIGTGMLSLYKARAKGDFLVNEFMTPLRFLPVLSENELTFERVLKTIEEYKQGFVLITDEDSMLKGIISNADLRRGLLKQLDHLAEIRVQEMINFNPVSIRESNNLEKLFATLHGLPFIVLFLPVTNESGKLTGAVLLNNLTRG